MHRLFLSASFALAAALGLATGPARAQWYQGPSGALGGSPYDGWVLNGRKLDISGIEVISRKGSGSIHCVIAEYEGAGAAGPDQCNVANTSDSSTHFALAPDEYILGIDGTYTDHITSLRFYSNKRNSPVYGEGRYGQPFGYTAPVGQMIVSFQQNLDARLHSIGVMYAPCDRSTKLCK